MVRVGCRYREGVVHVVWGTLAAQGEGRGVDSSGKRASYMADRDSIAYQKISSGQPSVNSVM